MKPQTMRREASPEGPLRAGATGEPAAEGDQDRALQACRRADWRFLLPDPHPRRVAGIGAAAAPLVDAAAHVGSEVTLLDPGALAGERRRFDAVVLRNPDPGLIAAARDLLAPSGVLYLEVDRRGRSGESLRGPAQAARLLEGLGLSEVAAHWHWPDFEGCQEIAPLGEPAAVRLALSRRRSDRGARIKAVVAASLLRLGLFERGLPCWSALGRQEEA